MKEAFPPPRPTMPDSAPENRPLFRNPHPNKMFGIDSGFSPGEAKAKVSVARMPEVKDPSPYTPS